MVSYSHTKFSGLVKINHHSEAWGIPEAPLPWCLYLLWPSIHGWLFDGPPGKCDLENCCKLRHLDSLQPTHYRVFNDLQFVNNVGIANSVHMKSSILKHSFLDQHRCEENVVLVSWKQFPYPSGNKICKKYI